MSDKKKKLM